GSLQRLASAAKFVLEPAGTVPADSRAYLRQSPARDPLHVADLFDGTFGLFRRKLGSQFALQNDYRQCVSEQIVEIPGDALPLGHLGEMLHLFPCAEQLMRETPALRVMNGDRAHQRSQDYSRNPEVARQMQ